MIRLIACAVTFALLAPAVATAAAPKRKPTAAPKAAPAVPRISFTVVSEGKGPSPGPEDVVRIAYMGRLADGTVFDQDGDAIFPMADMVIGFRQALLRMKKGGVYHVTIPPSLGYGPEASGPIPANATLTFDIMLFEFRTQAEIEAIRQRQLQQQQPSSPSAAP